MAQNGNATCRLSFMQLRGEIRGYHGPGAKGRHLCMRLVPAGGPGVLRRQIPSPPDGVQLWGHGQIERCVVESPCEDRAWRGLLGGTVGWVVWGDMTKGPRRAARAGLV